MAVFLLLVIHWYTSLFFQSFFHHRYAAHAVCTMSRTVEKLFFIGCFITQGSSYISAKAYGAMHRLHHAHTDTEKDPHSPSTSSNLFTMMWDTRNNYFDIYTGKTEVPAKFMKDLPEWDEFDKYAHNYIARLAWGAIYISLYYVFATEWWQYAFLLVHFAMGSFQGAVVNYWAHVLGYVNFKQNNTSKNIVPFDLFFWGESYHNNHHKFPGRLNNAVKWFEWDMGYVAMRIMHALGIIRLKHTSKPTEIIATPN